jgi:hypothetical protein
LAFAEVAVTLRRAMRFLIRKAPHLLALTGAPTAISLDRLTPV